MELGRVWNTTHIISGYEIDVGELAIRLPDAIRMDEWGILNNPMFRPGNRIITAKGAQKLRVW